MIQSLMHPASWPEAVVAIALIVAGVWVVGRVLEVARQALRR